MRRFLDVAELSVGTEWVDIVSVTMAGGGGSTEHKAELVSRFERELVLPALWQLMAIVDPTRERLATLRSLKEFMDLRQLPHLGPLYTQRALTSLGWFRPADSAQWVASARLEAWAAQGMSVGNLVRTECIVAWVAASFRFRDLLVEVPGRLFPAGVPSEADEEVRALLRPTFRHMARDDHAERAALLWVTLQALDACRAGTGALADLAGAARLYVSHFPCLSCVAVLGQFARLAPGALLEVAFDDAWQED